MTSCTRCVGGTGRIIGRHGSDALGCLPLLATLAQLLLQLCLAPLKLRLDNRQPLAIPMLRPHETSGPVVAQLGWDRSEYGWSLHSRIVSRPPVFNAGVTHRGISGDPLSRDLRGIAF